MPTPGTCRARWPQRPARCPPILCCCAPSHPLTSPQGQLCQDSALSCFAESERADAISKHRAEADKLAVTQAPGFLSCLVSPSEPWILSW